MQPVVKLCSSATLDDDAAHGRLRLIERLQAMPKEERTQVLRATDVWGNTLLHKAAGAPHSRHVVEQLITLGADLDAPGRGGLRPRMTAAADGNLENATLLASLGGRAHLGPMTEVDWRQYLAAVMGLTGFTHTTCVVGLPPPARPVCTSYPLEGYLHEAVFVPMAQAFAEYCELSPHVSGDAAARITEALQTAPLLLERTPAAIAAQVAAGEAVIIPSGWFGHATTHAFLGDLGVYSNRSRFTSLRTMLTLRAEDACSRAALIGAALSHRNGSALTNPFRLEWACIRHGVAFGHPLRCALRALRCKAQKTPNCTVGNAKAAVLALLLLEARRSDPANWVAEAARSHATFKQFTTYLRYHALHTYIARHLPGDPRRPPDLALVVRAHQRLLATGRLADLPWMQQTLEADVLALEAAWPSE